MPSNTRTVHDIAAAVLALEGHQVAAGIDQCRIRVRIRDLDIALKEAAQETIKFLQKERGLTPEDAYSLAAIGVNYVIGEAVDDVLMVYGAIPKKLFTTNQPFWSKP